MLALFVGFDEDLVQLLPDGDRLAFVTNLLFLLVEFSQLYLCETEIHTSGILRSIGCRVNIFLTQNLEECQRGFLDCIQL